MPNLGRLIGDHILRLVDSLESFVFRFRVLS